MPYEVLLVDDHKIMRDGLKAILHHAGDFHVMNEAETGVEAVEICRHARPDLILMDIGLPGLNGVETTREILRYFPEDRIVILSMYDDERSVVSAIRAGARAFVIKRASDGDVLEALRTVAKGGSYFSPQVSGRVLGGLPFTEADETAAAPGLNDLSPRELQVLRLVAEGKTSKEIAVFFQLGLQTVRSYRKTMMKKLGVNNIAGLTHLALSAGLTRLASPPGAEATGSASTPGSANAARHPQPEKAASAAAAGDSHARTAPDPGAGAGQAPAGPNRNTPSGV